MTGLDKIISQIDADSAARCNEILAEAEKQAKEIADGAAKKAEEIKAERETALAKKLDNMKQSAISSADLKKNQIVLSGKLTAIENTLDKAVEVIKGLPKKEYFEILKELVVKNALSGGGVISFSAEDTKKLPQNFIDTVNSALKGKGTVAIGKPADIDSGFILMYGEIDINCTFKALVAEKRDEIRDALNKLLFN